MKSAKELRKQAKDAQNAYFISWLGKQKKQGSASSIILNTARLGRFQTDVKISNSAIMNLCLGYFVDLGYKVKKDEDDNGWVEVRW